MKIKVLTKSEINKSLKKLPEWGVNTKYTELHLTRTFKNHIDALVFIARITVHAQVLDHHPEILFTYNKVKLKLTTKEAKGITKKDIDLASRIAQLGST